MESSTFRPSTARQATAPHSAERAAQADRPAPGCSWCRGPARPDHGAVEDPADDAFPAKWRAHYTSRSTCTLCRAPCARRGSPHPCRRRPRTPRAAPARPGACSCRRGRWPRSGPRPFSSAAGNGKRFDRRSITLPVSSSIQARGTRTGAVPKVPVGWRARCPWRSPFAGPPDGGRPRAGAGLAVHPIGHPPVQGRANQS